MIQSYYAQRQNIWKESNIFDPIQESLDQAVFDGTEPRPRVKNFIEKVYYRELTRELGLPDPENLVDLYITGSLTTYQWGETSDCDVSVFPNFEEIEARTGLGAKEVRRRLISMSIDKIDGTFLPGTTHPLQFFVVSNENRPADLYQPGLRSAYSLDDEMWLVEPEPERVHDIAVELPELYKRANDMANKMSTMLDHDPDQARELWMQVHMKRQLDQRAGLGDFSEGNIVYKYMLHEGLFDRIRNELNEYIAAFKPEDKVIDPYYMGANAGAPVIVVDGRRLIGDVTEQHVDMLERLGLSYDQMERQGVVRFDPNTGEQWVEWYGGWQPREAKKKKKDDLSLTEQILEQAKELETELTENEAKELSWAVQEEFLTIDKQTHVEIEPGAYKPDNSYKFVWLPQREMVKVWQDDEYGVDSHNVQDMKIEGHIGMLATMLGIRDPYAAWWEDKHYEAFDKLLKEEPLVMGYIRGRGAFTVQVSGHRTNIEPENLTAVLGLPSDTQVDVLSYGSDDASKLASPFDNVTLKVIYDFAQDRIILGTQAEASSLASSKIIGTYDGRKVVLEAEAEHWINANYFRRLWAYSYPTRPLEEVSFKHGMEDEQEIVLPTRPPKRRKKSNIVNDVVSVPASDPEYNHTPFAYDTRDGTFYIMDGPGHHYDLMKATMNEWPEIGTMLFGEHIISNDFLAESRLSMWPDSLGQQDIKNQMKPLAQNLIPMLRERWPDAVSVVYYGEELWRRPTVSRASWRKHADVEYHSAWVMVGAPYNILLWDGATTEHMLLIQDWLEGHDDPETIEDLLLSDRIPLAFGHVGYQWINAADPNAAQYYWKAYSDYFRGMEPSARLVLEAVKMLKQEYPNITEYIGRERWWVG